nr:MAG TPA: hypothetical protein [Caudoviricetes sp.]
MEAAAFVLAVTDVTKAAAIFIKDVNPSPMLLLKERNKALREIENGEMGKDKLVHVCRALAMINPNASCERAHESFLAERKAGNPLVH